MNARGFTLIETLIAFAILAVALVALYEAVGTGFRSFDRAAAVEEAVLIAQSRLDLITAERRLPLVRRGVVEGTPYEWRVEELRREAMAGGAAGVRPTLFRVVISRSGDARAAGVALERLMLVAPSGGQP